MFMEGRFRLIRAVSGRAFKRRGEFRSGEEKVNVARLLIQVRQKHVRSVIQRRRGMGLVQSIRVVYAPIMTFGRVARGRDEPRLN